MRSAGWLLLGLAVLLPAVLPAVGARAAGETGFLNAVIRVGSSSLPYVVYVPRDYTPEKRWPVVLFLHGSGERGDNGLAQTEVGIGRAIRLHPERFPCLVVMPQCPAGKSWGAGAQDAPDVATLALAAVDEVVRKYNGDPDRLYLTGLSMGGHGTWGIAAQNPGKFAALMPICGEGKPAEMAPPLKDLPIWVFHGDADKAVPVERSREMVQALEAVGSTSVRYTEYPGVGHNSWDNAYGDAAAISWLFSHRRRP